MASVKCTCPHCHRLLSLTQGAAGQVQCPSCGQRFSLGVPPPQLLQTGVSSAQTTAKTPAPHASPAGATSIKPQANVSFAQPRSSSSRLWLWLVAVVGTGLLAASGLAVLFIVLFLGRGGENAEAGNDEFTIDSKMDKVTREKKVKKDDVPREIREAIDKGVTYIKGRLTKGGNLYGNVPDHNTGAMALGGLTLLECGVSPRDEAVRKAIARVHSATNRQLTDIYAIALAILFMDRLLENQDVTAKEKNKHRRVLQTLALRIVAGQQRTKSWAYHCPRLTPQQEKQLRQSLIAGTFKPGDRRFRRQRGLDDNSVAQFAVLALWVARKYDIPVSASLIVEEKRYRSRQNKNDGSWPYRSQGRGGNGTPQMTCSGLIGLAVGHAIRNEVAEKKKEPRQKTNFADAQPIKKAFTFVGKALGRLDVKGAKHRTQIKALREAQKDALAIHDQATAEQVGQQILAFQKEARRKRIAPHPSPLDLYFLWSVERVGVIYGMNEMDGQDWYDRGSKVILEQQRPDGSWMYRFGQPVGTCFALLFLNRSNLVKDLSDKLQQLRAAVGIERMPEAPLPPRREA